MCQPSSRHTHGASIYVHWSHRGRYSTNLAEDKTELRFKPADLAGCPPEWIVSRTDPAGDVVVTLKYPDIIPVLQLCEVSETRRRLSAAKECDAFKDNLELVAEGIALRKKIAVLLGYGPSLLGRFLLFFFLQFSGQPCGHHAWRQCDGAGVEET